MIYRIFILIIFLLFSSSIGFEIKSGVYDSKARIVINNVKNANNIYVFSVDNVLIIKLNDKYENSKFKLDKTLIKEFEVYISEDKKSSLIYITPQDDVSYKYFSLSNPDRFVIDFKRTTLIQKTNTKNQNKNTDNYESEILSTILKNLDTDNKVSAIESYEIKSSKGFFGKKRIIVIDPGHGGHDPGAMANGLKEKDINLKIAMDLKKYLEKDGRFIVYLTRDEDVFVPLYDRTLIALEKKADLFISIHTNASENPNLSGTYVYTLNLKGATSKLAKMVEERENQKVLNVVKVSANPNVNKIVADMAISHTMTEGLNFAKFVERNSKNFLKNIDFKKIDSANFAVLKTPSIPAVLVETAFITNERDAKLLANDEFLDNFAKVLYKSIADYFFKYKNLVFDRRVDS